MKQVKLQPRQHTIVCNDEEIHHLIEMIEFYITRDPDEDDLENRKSIMTSSNPCIDNINSIYTALNNMVGIPNTSTMNVYDF